MSAPDLPPDLVEALSSVSTATITTILFAKGLRNRFLQDVRPLGPRKGTMVGPAFTLRCIPAREDLDTLDSFRGTIHPQRRAVEEAPPGSVLVIDARKEARAATAGAILCRRMARRGVAGLVTDGGLRDAEAIVALDLLTYCARPSAPTNLVHHHAVDLDVPIGCGDVAVFPGDVIVGDGDGVVVIPRQLADEVAAVATEKTVMEEFITTQVDSGRSLFGLYPPDASTLAEFETWQANRRQRR